MEFSVTNLGLNEAQLRVYEGLPPARREEVAQLIEEGGLSFAEACRQAGVELEGITRSDGLATQRAAGLFVNREDSLVGAFKEAVDGASEAELSNLDGMEDRYSRFIEPLERLAVG